MKTLLVFFCLVATFNVCMAQGHFITAGQRDSMIYTEYSSSGFCTQAILAGGTCTNEIDINHNFIPDVFTYLHIDNLGVLSHCEICHLSVDSSLFIKCRWKHKTHNVGTVLSDCSDSGMVLNYYAFGDTLRDDGTGIWSNIGTVYDGCDSDPLDCVLKAASDTDGANRRYVFLMSVSGTDTLFGYLLVYEGNYWEDGYVLTSAIEGPTAYYNYSGVTDIKADGPAIYPNPFDNQISIQCETPFSYQLYDLTGKQVLQHANQHTINTSALVGGVYVIEINSKGNVFRRKLFKQ